MQTPITKIANNKLNPICSGEDTIFWQICPPLRYFNIAPKGHKSFALMHPDFKSNLVTHICRKFGVSRTTGSDVIFDFVKGVSRSFEHNACLLVRVFYSLYCVIIINANLQQE